MIQSKEFAIGMDIGGTNLKIGLMAEQGQLVEFQSLLLKRKADHSADIRFICGVIKAFIEKNDVSHQLLGVGVASPGILNTTNGIVNRAVNLDWENIRLVEIIKNSLQLDVSLISDSVAAAIGEQYHSAAGLANLFICVGTGVGASLVSDYEFYTGQNGEAINLGHMSVIHNGQTCKCGNKGCLENYVSSSALTERARNEIDQTDTLLKPNTQIKKQLDAHHIYEKWGLVRIKAVQGSG